MFDFKKMFTCASGKSVLLEEMNDLTCLFLFFPQAC